METRFAGKVAIVTGAGQGIGKGVALRLAREGAAVVVAEYNADTAAETGAEIQVAGGQALPYAVDIANVGAVQTMVNDVVAALGRIDILVNNAGVVQTKPMLDLSEADWDRVVDINQRGTFFCLQAVAQQMIRQLPEALRSGSGLADVLSHQLGKGRLKPPLRTSWPPATARSSISPPLPAGEAGLFRPIMPPPRPRLSVLPNRRHWLWRRFASTSTPFVPASCHSDVDSDRPGPGRLFGAKEGEAMAAFIQQVPLKRAATPDDLAGVVAFLCSTDADYITGQAINVDGGFEMN